MVALEWSMQNLYGVEPGEVLVGGVRHRLGGRPQLHRLRAVVSRLHDDPLRGQAGRHARRRRVLARHRRARLRRHVHRADGVPRDQEGRPRGKLFGKYDLSKFRTLFLAGERADPDTVQWAERLLKKPVHRSLVADRDRLVHRRQSSRPRPACRSSTARRRCRCRATTSAWWTTPARPVPRGTMGSLVVKLPLPPSCLPTLWQQDERLRESYLAEVPRLLQDGRRRLHRRRRLCLRDGPHRRHHQCRRPPALDRRHGGGAGSAPGRRRMRGDRHQG